MDVLRFDAAVESGDEDSLRDAVATYAGPLLEGCYEAWVFLERESREQACLTALETITDRAVERGDHEEAIARAYAGVQQISFDGMQYRRDIGRRALRAETTNYEGRSTI